MDQRETGKGLSWALQCQRGVSWLLGKLLHPCPGAMAGMRRLLRHVLKVVYKQKKLLKELDISVDVLQGWVQRCSDWALVGQWSLDTYNQRGLLWGAGKQQLSIPKGSVAPAGCPAWRRCEEPCSCSMVTPGAPATGTSGDRGRDALSRVQGGSRAVVPSPRSPAAVTRCPAPAHPGLGPPRPSTY